MHFHLGSTQASPKWTAIGGTQLLNNPKEFLLAFSTLPMQIRLLQIRTGNFSKGSPI